MNHTYTNAQNAQRREGLNRRQALALGMAGVATAATIGVAPLARAQSNEDVNALQLETVLGPVKGADIQKVLAHEHLFVDFFGPTDPNYMNVNWADVSGTCVNRALEVKEQGVNLLIDWGPLGVGRNVLLLRDVSRRTGVNIVCPTGIYKSLIPPQYQGLSVDQIAARFVEELTKGCDGTMIRAGFIKMATTEAGPTESDTVIHHAAAIAGREAGCTIALHSPHIAATNTVVATLESEKFPLERFVWGHAQPSNIDDHKAIAGRGATVQFDAISANSDPFFNGPTDDASMLDRLEAMASAGFDKQVIVSADASTFVNPQKWQYDRDSTYVHRDFQPKLVERLGENLANQILRDNVIRAFRRGDKVS